MLKNNWFFFIILFLSLTVIVYGIGLTTPKRDSQPTVERKSAVEIEKNSFRSPKKTTKSSSSSIKREAVFIPYWADFKKGDKDLSSRDRLIYFGIAINPQGIDKHDLGFRRLNRFKKIARDNKQWLVLRMTDDKLNQQILADQNNWSKINSQVVNFAKENNFQGLVLDLEPKGIAFDGTVAVIDAFVANLHRLSKERDLPLAVLVYGDLFFRRRPFNLKNIAANSEEIMVMAYDLHKSRGEPGPNFPLYGREKYGYDLEKMTVDFLRFVPADKLTVVFGMYGYDWSVDEKKRPLKKARAKTLNKIRQELLNDCQWQDCVVKNDRLSRETEINYLKPKIVDGVRNLSLHIVWFEDEKSVAVKSKFLETRGIFSFARWAWGYY